MLITKQSSLTGNIHQLEINVTEQQLNEWKNGKLIQDVMPHLSKSEREFLMTGNTQEEWDDMFGKSPFE